MSRRQTGGKAREAAYLAAINEPNPIARDAHLAPAQVALMGRGLLPQTTANEALPPDAQYRGIAAEYERMAAETLWADEGVAVWA